MSLVRNTPPGVRFNTVGARHGGRVVEDGREVQARDFKTGLPEVWPDSGKPKMQYVVTVDTGQIDPYTEGDDGLRSIFFSGQRLYRLKEVLRAARVGDVKAGGVLFVTYVSDKVSAVGGNPQKVYDVEYEPPKAGVVTPAAVDDRAGGGPDRVDPSAAPAGVDPATYARIQAEVLARLNSGRKPADELPPF